eukprot:CAMPEP_0172781958 /NCGR_PEP_ID=MMETSP1074-20121228/203693_1 /TAXON_ID=2916 /ORGANISM="Ceratium fusus, Strain PA161109" /LENGTH=192 /DNA_ID=CAMNT_0013618941 /DNA_START=60 /DNA_END=638 /DNA_ORIENTATION=+
MVSMASEENNCVAANQPAQRAGKRTSSPAAKATLNGGAPKADPKAQAAADGKSQDKKPLKKPPAMGMAGLLLLVMCVLTVSVHLFFGISFLTKLGMPFAGALKECRIPLGITVVGMLIGAAAFAKRHCERPPLFWDIFPDKVGNALRRCFEGMPHPPWDYRRWHANRGGSLCKEASGQWSGEGVLRIHEACL